MERFIRITMVVIFVDVNDNFVIYIYKAVCGSVTYHHPVPRARMRGPMGPEILV